MVFEKQACNCKKLCKIHQNIKDFVILLTKVDFRDKITTIIYMLLAFEGNQ